MDATFNVTYITVGGHVEMGKYRYLYFVFMFLVYVLILVSNCTIVCVIWIHRNLHEPMYIFIAALSVNSVLFSTAVYPKFLKDILSEKQIISYSACLFQYFLYYSLGCSDFLLLSCMAYDRYVSICKPLQYQTIMGKITVCFMLFFSWFLPAFQVGLSVGLRKNNKLCSFTLKGILCNNLVNMLECVSSVGLFVSGLFTWISMAILPAAFILFTYTKIFIVTHRSHGAVRRKAAETCLPHLLVLLCFSCLCAFDIMLPRVSNDFSNTLQYIMSVQVLLYSPLFNPIIYGLKMKEISKHLKRW
ncbi:olfactory receptor 2AG2-like [Lampetra planeri]